MSLTSICQAGTALFAAEECVPDKLPHSAPPAYAAVRLYRLNRHRLDLVKQADIRIDIMEPFADSEEEIGAAKQ